MRSNRGRASVHVVDHDAQSSIVQVHGLGSNTELFVRTTGLLDATATMWLPLILPVAMRAGKPLHIHGAVDRVALTQSVQAQRTLASWWPQWLNVVEVTADSVVDAGAGTPSPGVGLAFSGGVDAFHSLHRHRHEVTHLWFVHGFDVPLWRTDLRADISSRLAVIADRMGMEFIEVVTNVKPWADRSTPWGEVYCGPATAGIALGHGRLWGRALIASSGEGEDIPKWSTHPDLDHFWSSGNVEVIHDAPEFGRIDKVRQIAHWDLAMENLRVCWLNPGQEYNCGTCEKCVRTIFNFITADAAGRCRTLPSEPSLPLPALDPEYDELWAQSLTGLRSLTPRRPDLEEAILEAQQRGIRARRRNRLQAIVRPVTGPIKSILGKG